jgi:hypothetical protein
MGLLWLMMFVVGLQQLTEATAESGSSSQMM